MNDAPVKRLKASQGDDADRLTSPLPPPLPPPPGDPRRYFKVIIAYASFSKLIRYLVHLVHIKCAHCRGTMCLRGWVRRQVGYDPRAHACILSHLNGIAVVCLAPSHPVMLRGLTVASVDFVVGPKGEDLSAIAISGKKKRGALSVHPGLVVCALLASNGERHLCRFGVKVNPRGCAARARVFLLSRSLWAGRVCVFYRGSW